MNYPTTPQTAYPVESLAPHEQPGHQQNISFTYEHVVVAQSYSPQDQMNVYEPKDEPVTPQYVEEAGYPARAAQVGSADVNFWLFMPERTTTLVLWFLFFTLGSVALSLVVLFGCSSPATSGLYVVQLEPYNIYTASINVLFYTGLGETTNKTAHNATSIPTSEFFTHPLPWQYAIGMSGVCRVYNSTDVSSPSVTFKTVCQRQLHPSADLLPLIAQELPNGTADPQYTNWATLLREAIPGFEENTAPKMSRLIATSSILLILSVVWSTLTALATLGVKSLYPGGSLVLATIGAVFAFAASALWTAAIAHIQDAYMLQIGGVTNNNPNGVHTSAGIWILWAAALARLAVTPRLLLLMIQIVLFLVFIVLKCLQYCCERRAYATTRDADGNVVSRTVLRY